MEINYQKGYECNRNSKFATVSESVVCPLCFDPISSQCCADLLENCQKREKEESGDGVIF